MKKSLLCIILSFLMIAAALPVAAHQNFAEPLIGFSVCTDTAALVFLITS